MKKYFLILALACWAQLAHSQILISLLLGDKLNSDKLEFGVDGGFALTKFNGNFSNSYMRTFNLGFYFDIKLKNPNWMLNTGLRMKSNMGANGLAPYPIQNPLFDSSFLNSTVTRRLGYFYVPVLLKYQFQNHIYVEGGVQLGLRNKAVDTFKQSLNNTDDLTYEHDVRNHFRYLDGGLTFGLGYRLMNGNGMNLGARVYYGLVDINLEATQPAQSNMGIYLNVGVPIGKAPKN